MKRELEPFSDDSKSDVEKKAKHSEPGNIDANDKNYSFFPLLDLPNDELKLILRHLPIDDRLNLKETCKTAERRLIMLDPSMRRWNLHLRDDNYKRMKISLSKAKLKHIKDGNLQEIDISLTINYSMENTKIPFVHLLLAEILIKEWKNNIVSLSLSISGTEFYLLDPEVKMPRLNALILHDGEQIVKTVRNINTSSSYHNNDSSESGNSPDSDDEDNEGDNQMVAPKSERIKIASFLIQHHEDTLQELCLHNLDVSISPGLQLTEFSAKKVDFKVVESVLNSSSSSLVVLELDEIYENDNQSINLSQKLLCLKEFRAFKVDPSYVSLIISSSYETLETLVLIQNNNPKPNKAFELGSIDLKIKTFETNIDSEDLLAFLKASQKSLENLRIKNCMSSHLVATNTSFNLNGVELKLVQITATKVSPKVIASLLNASSKYIKVLDLSNISSRFDDNFTQSCGQLQVEKIITSSVSPSIIASIISVSNESLEVLHIGYNIIYSLFNLANTQFNEDNLQFQLQCSSLKIKEFSASNAPSEMIEAVIKASHEHLEDLSISDPRNIEIMDLDGVELKLISFSLANFPIKFLESLLRSSYKTLQDLELTFCLSNVPDLNQWANMKLQIKKFVADQISLHLVDSILSVSQATLEELTLKRLRIYHGYDDYNLNTQFKQLKKFTAINTDSQFFISVLRSCQTTLEVLHLQHMRLANCTFNVNLNLKNFVGHKIEAHLANLILLSSISSLEYLYLVGTHEMRFSRIKVIEISLSGRDGFIDSAEKKNIRLNNTQILETLDQQYPTNNYPAMKQLSTGIHQLLLEPAVFHKCVIEKDGKIDKDWNEYFN